MADRFVLRAAAALAAVGAVLGSVQALAQDEDAFDRTPRDCLQVAAVDRTVVLDDQTVLFYVRGKKVYRNYLPKKCPGLKREDRFMYEARQGRLCNIDSITVLELWNASFTPGFTCPLGKFQPITVEEADDLTLKPEDRGKRNAIETKAVELPKGSSDTAPAPAEPSDSSEAAPDDSAAPQPEPRHKGRRRRS